MQTLNDEIKNAWENREGPAIFTTVGATGVPNSVYVTCTWLYEGRAIVIADNYFNKTRQNILANNKASILFITKDKKSYQIKGIVNYHVAGEIFNFMKSWNPSKHPGHAAAELVPEEVFQGSVKLDCHENKNI